MMSKVKETIRDKKIRELRERKKHLRVSTRAVRREIHTRHGREFAEEIRTNFIQALNIMPQTTFGAYYPIGAEVNCRPLMDTLHAMGHTISLPVITGATDPLIYRMYKSGDQLEKGGFGTPQPCDYMPVVVPDILIIPMMGYSDKGYRLGYGSGFFDRTIELIRKQKPMKAIGLAYSGQRIDDMPVEAHDQKLDLIITEKGTVKIRQSRR